MQIVILLDSRKYITLDVEPANRIIDVKNKIEKINGIKSNQQQLLYNGQVLYDDVTLEKYSIKNDSALRFNILPKPIKIYINNPFMDKKFSIMTNPYLSIHNLKNEIANKISLQPCQFDLILNNHKKMLNDCCSLNDYSIQKGSSLILIRTLKGGKPVIYLYPEEDNLEVKVKIEMNPKEGKIISKYPLIKDNEENIWKVKAYKNGDIMHENYSYDYLFWECIFNQPFIIDEGFVIKGVECFDFFKEKLKYIGFKDKPEANDFSLIGVQ